VARADIGRDWRTPDTEEKDTGEKDTAENFLTGASGAAFHP
jgi:hypothetical protein